MTDYIQMIVNAMFTGIGAAIGSVLGQKILEKTRLKDLDNIIHKEVKRVFNDDKLIQAIKRTRIKDAK